MGSKPIALPLHQVPIIRDVAGADFGGVAVDEETCQYFYLKSHSAQPESFLSQQIYSLLFPAYTVNTMAPATQ